MLHALLATAAATPWLPTAGDVRVGLGVQHLNAQRQLASPDNAGRIGPLCPGGVQAGRPAPYDCTTGGRFRNTTLALDVSAGLHEHLALDVYVPFVVDARFSDDLGATDARGLGDVRIGLRTGWMNGPWAVAGAVTVKAPTGPAGLVDRDVPLGDAQWDVTPDVRAGVSLWPWGWLETQQRFAIRARSALSDIDPGEEWTGTLGGGLTPIPEVAGVGLQAQLEWIWAMRDTDAFGLSRPGRKLLQVRTGPFVQVLPATGHMTGPLWVQAMVVVPVAGQRWPAAASVGLNLATTLPFRFTQRTTDRVTGPSRAGTQSRARRVP